MTDSERLALMVREMLLAGYPVNINYRWGRAGTIPINPVSLVGPQATLRV